MLDRFSWNSSKSNDLKIFQSNFGLLALTKVTISFLEKRNGESASVSVVVSENLLEHVEPNLCKNYTDRNIYNTDET